MMTIALNCANGHRLRTEERHAGRRAQCPICGDSLTIPPIEKPMLTDTGAMRLLGTFEPSSRRPTESRTEFRPCSKCGFMMPSVSRICDHCGVYQR